MISTDDWMPDAAIDQMNLDEECVRQPGLFGYWASKEVNCIIAEDNAMVEFKEAEDNLTMVKARSNANMRSIDLVKLNALLGTELHKSPDVALWKELVILHPDVIKAQQAVNVAQRSFLECKHERLNRKNARRTMEAKAQELNNLIYLHNREYGAKESYTVQPKHVKTTYKTATRAKAEEHMATQLRKRIKP